MASLSHLLKRASGVLHNLRGDSVQWLGKDGDVVYSKNNVCVHAPSTTPAVPTKQISSTTTVDDGVHHSPGYLTIHCQNDDMLGVTLILQWLPNSTLEKNPKSIRTISPRGSDDTRARTKLRHIHGDTKKGRRASSSESSGPEQELADDTTTTPPSEPDTPSANGSGAAAPPVISVEMTGDQLTVTSSPGPGRPRTLPTADQTNPLGLPAINVIPHTPIRPTPPDEKESSSPATSGADDISDRGDLDEDLAATKTADSSPYTSEGEDAVETPTGGAAKSSILDHYSNVGSAAWQDSPEEFARSHNLMLPDGISDDGTAGGGASIGATVVAYTNRASAVSLFSVDLGKMRSMRLFFSDCDTACGQLVIASPESQYKILHFHHGGLDKLAQIFDQWNCVRAKSGKDGSPSPVPNQHFAVCRPEIQKNELDPEEGLYAAVGWDLWRASTNPTGAIDDSLALRKAIFFAGVDTALQREAWPFLLNVYPWTSSAEQRDTIRNDLFLQYQGIRKKRMTSNLKKTAERWQSVENSVLKDVVRTDRRNAFYEGDQNPNVDIMRNILLNYATFCPMIGYIQGMSDMLAPILCTIREEADAFWCFAGVMQRCIFVTSTRGRNKMDKNLEYLRELLKLMLPDFYRHLKRQPSGEALELMFTHRWILLCFKREFPEEGALRVWEACWATYRTAYFHLFICLAIVATYGQDVLEQQLPHDEILLYFASLAMHMDANTVLKKARGLLYQMCRLDKIPCTLAGVVALGGADADQQWDSAYQPTIECVQVHGTQHEPCPHAGIGQ